jgi:hypothetical protein
VVKNQKKIKEAPEELGFTVSYDEEEDFYSQDESEHASSADPSRDDEDFVPSTTSPLDFRPPNAILHNCVNRLMESYMDELMNEYQSVNIQPNSRP